jgi:MerR family transcriptional regulator, copper efflux regulator
VVSILVEESRSGMKIGEVAKRSGVGIETLRFYEKSGLLERPGRTYSGYRMYGDDVFERISFIKRAQVLGFTLDEIKQLVEHKRKGENPCAEVRAIAQRRLEELDSRIKQLRKYRKELAATIEEWSEIGEADGHVCGLIEGSQLKNGVSHGYQTRGNNL